MAKPKAPDVSKLSPTQKQIKRLLDQGKTPEQIAKKRKTSTNAVYQTVRRLKALGFTVPSTGNAAGNGAARRPSRSRSASRGRSRARRRAPAPPPPPPGDEPVVLDPASRINEARDAVAAERTTLAKQRENAEAERERLVKEAEAHGKAIEDIDLGIARLDHVLGEFDAKVEVAK